MQIPFWLSSIIGSVIANASGSQSGVSGASASVTVPFGAPDNMPASFRTDRPISEHFKLYEMTVTSNSALQQENRTLTAMQITKLGELALLMETVREICGDPISIHSGYRSPSLNAATAGSALHSQHMLCEAADWSIAGAPGTAEAVEGPFQKVLSAAKSGQIKFGQLIIESAARDYGSVYWVHISLGAPYRDQSRCGEVLRMENGSYVFLEKV